MNLQPRHGNRYLDTEPARVTFAMALFLPFVATAAVAARIYARFRRRLKLGPDDWLAMLALILHYCQVAGVFCYIFLGYFGHHFSDASPQQQLVDIKLSTFTQYPYALSLGLARCSICMLLIRIFFIRPFKIAAYGVLSFNVLWMIYLIIATSTPCLPFRFNWDPTIPGGHCISENSYLLSIAAWGLLIDVAITILPIPMIWNLHTSTRRKIGLSIVFGLWVLDILIGIFRIVTVLQLDVSDLTWSGVSTALWAVAEPSVAIVVACAPIYQVFLDEISLKTVLSRLRNKVSSHRSTDHGSRDPPLLDNGLGTQLPQGQNSYRARHVEGIELGTIAPSDRSSPQYDTARKGSESTLPNTIL